MASALVDSQGLLARSILRAAAVLGLQFDLASVRALLEAESEPEPAAGPGPEDRSSPTKTSSSTTGNHTDKARASTKADDGVAYGGAFDQAVRELVADELWEPVDAESAAGSGRRPGLPSATVNGSPAQGAAETYRFHHAVIR